MTPLTKRPKNADVLAPGAPVLDPADNISKLPEGIQAHILSFLPAQEAVRTCVLSRTWRDVWKFTRRLFITGKSVKDVQQFVDRLLRARLDGLEVASLDASDIRFNAPTEFNDDDSEDPSRYRYLDDEDMSSINRWICRVLECQIQMLRIYIDTFGWYAGYLEMDNNPLLVSRHLTRLQLTGVSIFCRCLNLDGCPALEHLEINQCFLSGVEKIRSLSLKSLFITSCDSGDGKERFQICIPHLEYLWLDNTGSPAAGECVRTPLLGRMPELVGATVRIDADQDKCDCDDPMACYHVMGADETSDIDSDSDDVEGLEDYAGKNTTKCVILEGLAHARDLVLIADLPTYIFRRDLRWCPTFSMLKTLVLSQVYRREPADCSVLERILEHAPLLEKLTLIYKKIPALEGKYKVEIKGYPDTKGKSTKISQHLQIVEINFEDVNAIFVNVLNFFGTLNICFETRVRQK